MNQINLQGKVAVITGGEVVGARLITVSKEEL